MLSFIFYFSYLSFPFLAFVIFALIKWHKNKAVFIASVFLILLSLSFIYSRFIETNMIFLQTTKIKSDIDAKIIVISDTHLGVYKDGNFLKRVVDEVNKIENADMVLIPGDVSYHPLEDLEDLKNLFSALKDLKVPVFAVLGNHDTGHPGPLIHDKLQKALEFNDVVFLNNSTSKIDDITILGLGDNWDNNDNISMIEAFSEEDNLIVLAHNPDTSLSYKNSIPDITVTGHSHGGQIRIPFIYKLVIPCEGDFDQGVYETEFGTVFVSAGLGETGLPMRLGIPPTIDVLELSHAI